MRTKISVFLSIIAFVVSSCTHAPDKPVTAKKLKQPQTIPSETDGQASQPAYKIKRNIPLAKFNGYDIVYDCYNCDPENAITDSIVLYAQKGELRKKLLNRTMEDNYLDDITIAYFSAHPFVYITASHTHGHFYGTLYALDTVNLKVTEVEELSCNFKTKIPKNLELRNWNGIRIENGKIFNGGYYRAEDGDAQYAIDREYKMVTIGPNHYVLKPIKETIQ